MKAACGEGWRRLRQAKPSGDPEARVRRVLRRNCFLALEELQAGLLCHLSSYPGAIRDVVGLEEPGLSGHSKGSSRVLDEVRNTAVVRLCMLVFLLFARSRNLIPACRFSEGQGDRQGPQNTRCNRLTDGRAASQIRGSRTRLSDRVDDALRRINQAAGGAASGPQGDLLDLDAIGYRRNLRIPDEYLERVLDLLLPPRERQEKKAGGKVCRLDYQDLDVRLLGDIYEGLMAAGGDSGDGNPPAGRRRRASSRKTSGTYYTPQHLVEYLVERALDPVVRPRAKAGAKPLSSDQILRVRVLDPAMGSGHFLLAATDFLARSYARALVHEGKAGGNPAPASKDLLQYRRLVAQSCIYGVDMNPLAVQLAKLTLWLFTGRPHQRKWVAGHHLRCGNSLLGAPFGQNVATYREILEGTGAGDRQQAAGAGNAKPFDWQDEFPEVASGDGQTPGTGAGFDAVVGNPPYLSFSGRQKVKSSVPLRRIYQAVYGRLGWVTSHGLFMLRALELAKPEGLVAMVVPDQVGHLVGYGQLRARILNAGSLIQVRYWGEDIFEQVTTPALTFVLRKGKEPRRRTTVIVSPKGGRHSLRLEDTERWSACPDLKIYRRMLKGHLAVKGFQDCGVHTGNAAHRLVLSSPARGTVPILEGRQIHPFRCDPPRQWLCLSYQPSSGEYFRISHPAVYSGTDILLRQTAPRPVAARHVFGCHFRNSVLGLKVPLGFSVEYLLGILNSDAAGFLYRTFSPESHQRAFPQIKIGTLRCLPIPDPTLSRHRSMVAEMEGAVRRLERDGEEPHPLLLGRLNQLAWQLYGLKPQTST